MERNYIVQFLPSSLSVVDEALKLAKIEPEKDVFVDPACGDGRL
jgi:hypothetical protein